MIRTGDMVYDLCGMLGLVLEIDGDRARVQWLENVTWIKIGYLEKCKAAL
jgi:hypothetical protein